MLLLLCIFFKRCRENGELRVKSVFKKKIANIIEGGTIEAYETFVYFGQVIFQSEVGLQTIPIKIIRMFGFTCYIFLPNTSHLYLTVGFQNW